MATVTSLPLPVLVTAVCAAFALSGCGVSIDLGGETTERSEREIVDAAAIERLTVETGNGRIRIVGAETDEIDVTARLRESDPGDATFDVREEDGTLHLEGHCDAGWFDRCSVGFDVTVPAGVDVDVRTDNGRIDLDRLDGSVRVKTDNGRIDGDRLAASRLEARTDNGRIGLDFSAAPDDVVATTDNGAVELRFPDDGDTHHVSTSTDNGSVDVDVRTDPASDRSIDVETDNGSIDVSYRD